MRTWHRKAATPITYWMLAFIVLGIIHWIFPEPSWLLIHVFTLGIVTNSIMLWSQTLTERFLQQRLPETSRPAQLQRTWALNGGIILVLVGQVAASWWTHHYLITWLGGLIVALVLFWHALSLSKQVQAAGQEKRHRPAAIGYILSTVWLIIGVCLGAALSMGLPGHWQEHIRQAHFYANIGGFVGIAAMSSLSVLFPAIWRVNGMRDRARLSIPLATAGLIIAILTPPALSAIGVICYVAAWVWIFHGFLVNVITVLRNPRDRITYPALSVFLSQCWLIITLVWYAMSLITTTPALPTLPLLLGFVAQLLIGTLSYLIPTTIGGGPSAVRAGLKELSRGTYIRVAAYNMALIGWIATENSWLRIIMSLIVFGVLVAYLPLVRRGVRQQRSVIRSRHR